MSLRRNWRATSLADSKLTFRELVHKRLSRSMWRIVRLEGYFIPKELQMMAWIAEKFPKEFHLFCWYSDVAIRDYVERNYACE